MTVEISDYTNCVERINYLELENSGLSHQIHEMETELINLKNRLNELENSIRPVKDFILGD